MKNLSVEFEKHNDEYLKFERVEQKLNHRPDLHALLLLDSLLPGAGRSMISAAEHDQYWLDVDVEGLAEIITDEQILDLVRCGVNCDDDGLSFWA